MRSNAFELAKALSRRIAPDLTKALKMYKTLSIDAGHYRSIRTSSCIDRQGNPLPWYTYPAIEYLNQLDFSDRSVFEFGAGNSTLFWAKRARSVVSVEDDKRWFDKVKRARPTNVSCHLCEDRHAYVNFVKNLGETFDIIAVDGNYRRACAEASIEYLNKEGFMILDNADWCQETAAFLRAQDLIEVDMSGFGPINNYTWTTSLFLRRGVRLTPSGPAQPMPPVGSWPVARIEADIEGVSFRSVP